MKSDIVLAFVGGVLAHFVGGRVLNGILFQLAKRDTERSEAERQGAQ